MIRPSLTLTLGAVSIYRAATKLVYNPRTDSIIGSTGFAMLCTLLAILWNRTIYPYSNAFRFSESLLIQEEFPLLLWSLTAIFLATLILAAAYFFKTHALPAKIVAGIGIALTTWGFFPAQTNAIAHANRNSPDVIIIGIDSLRPDHLTHTGNLNLNLMPELDTTLSQMVVFNDALTPLARTFVSYMSTLSGKHPIHHGARFNLYPRSEFSAELLLPSSLQKIGYQTLLVTDESRFANFDRSLGFDKIASPKVGALDFVIGSTYDLVATNIILAIPAANRLMPHVNANRAAYRTYNWKSHSARFSRALRDISAHHPLFLVHHLCLPHWPYLPDTIHHDDGKLFATGDPWEDSTLLPYRRALHVADRQFKLAIEDLRKSGRLKNSILIVISDHGEAFATSRDAMRVVDEEKTRQMMFYGHGASTISPEQSRVLLAAQRYIDGEPRWEPRIIEGPASLLDIAPTIVDQLSLQHPHEEFDGISLVPALEGKQQALSPRTRFLETGLRSSGIERLEINERQVAEEMAYLYKITPDLRFEIDPRLLPLKIQQKQRAATQENLIVAAIPKNENPMELSGCWVMANTKNRTAKCIPPDTDDALALKLRAEVCNLYKKDHGFSSTWCNRNKLQ